MMKNIIISATLVITSVAFICWAAVTGWTGSDLDWLITIGIIVSWFAAILFLYLGIASTTSTKKDSVGIHEETKKRLEDLAHHGQTIDGVIRELLDLADKYETLVRKYSSDDLPVVD